MVVRMGKEYLDQSLKPEIREKALLEEMSLEEKAAQLTGVFPFDEEYKNYDAIAESTRYGIGEVSTLEMRRMETLEEAAAWQRKVQEIVMENSEHHIPAIFHMEGLCGPFILHDNRMFEERAFYCIMENTSREIIKIF